MTSTKTNTKVNSILLVSEGKGTHGKHRGAPKKFNKDIVRSIIREAKEKGVSQRALCAEKGVVYVSFMVNKNRFGLTKPKTAKVKSMSKTKKSAPKKVKAMETQVQVVQA